MSRKRRKICVFSGKRGGFGAYLPLLRLMESDSSLELQILLGDMHTAKEFGNTADEVRKSFPSTAIEIVEMGTGRQDSPLARAENLGVCLTKSAQVISKLNPDVVMVHGDRGEHLMVAFAAVNLGKVVTHTQGGEVSGNIDDIQRHAITKLAHLHFPETRLAAKNVGKLGEEAWRIHTVGSLYIDRIVKKMYTENSVAKVKWGLKLSEDYFLIIFHPDTYKTKETNYLAMQALLTAVKFTGLRAIVTYPCSDPGYEGVLSAIEEVKNDSTFLIHKNIDNLDFLGLLAGAKALVGNSSSALKEAPYFKLAALDIGRRQEGREKESNVHTVGMSMKDIEKGLNFILCDKKFRSGLLKRCGFLFGDGCASEKILKMIKKIDLNDRLLRKHLQ